MKNHFLVKLIAVGMATCSCIGLLDGVAADQISHATTREQNVLSNIHARVILNHATTLTSSRLNQQQQYEHGFVAGYMQAYVEACGNFDTIVPPIPKPNEGATSYADGYAAGKMQGETDGAENCPEEED